MGQKSKLPLPPLNAAEQLLKMERPTKPAMAPTKVEGANKPTTAKSGKKAAAEKVATKEATAAKAADQKAAAEEAAAEKAAAAKVAVEKADDGSSGSQPGMRNTPEGAGPEAIDGNGPQPLALQSLPGAGGSESTNIQVSELPRPSDDTADAAGGGKADKAKHATDARELEAKSRKEAAAENVATKKYAAAKAATQKAVAEKAAAEKAAVEGCRRRRRLLQ